MHQLTIWLGASVPLVAGIVALAFRIYRGFDARLERERRAAQRMSEVHLATIEALALAIDAKDQTSHNHIRRVRSYATGIARAIGLSDEAIQAIRAAAVLHDIGQLAVPEHILAKPGPLTPEEFQKVRIHPQVGAGIVGSVPFPYPVTPLILNHHERWDGTGYPNGAKGEEIPLGARVLGLVDYFDSLRSDRPYHKAISDDEALTLLEQESGKGLDPQLVATFIRLFPQLKADAEQDVKNAPTVAFPVRPAAGQPPVTIDRGDEARSSVFDDIALAHREIYALYQIAQTMGTSLGIHNTMALIASKLANLVPFTTCALFVYSEGVDTLYCRFATGIDAEVIQQLALHNGQGLTGWVARNRRPLVNARPSADLEAAGCERPTALQSALVCPLIFADRFIGTLAVYHTAPSFYRDDHRRLLDRVCEQASAVIHNSIVFEQTQEASLTDPLTGLPNTRFMVMHLRRELARAERLNAEVALLVMDLNDFKYINDTYGHHVGDCALREVAHALRATTRPYDVCVRYAGDEFIVVLSGCGRDEAERKRAELQEAVAGLYFEPQPGAPLPLSISAGAAVYPHDGGSYESLLERADAQMYRDKSSHKRAVQEPADTGGSELLPVI